MSLEDYEQMNAARGLKKVPAVVAAYCRVSTDHADQANSFESQKRFFTEYIRRHPDWKLYEIFADEGVSGTETAKRTAFLKMLDCARRGAFDTLLTKEISRFARNTLDSIYYTRELKKYGVGVLFLNDGINTLDGDAELRLTVMASVAQEESRRISQRVKWGQKRRMEQGVVFGRSMLGYDIRGGKMYINQKGAAVVRQIFKKYIEEGKSTHTIARELTAEGFMPPQAARWHPSVILRILKNEKYCGDLVQKKTYTPDFLSHKKKYNHGQEDFVIIRNHHTPIVSRMLFEQAGRLLAERGNPGTTKDKYRRRYPLSGKIKCGECGATYVSRIAQRQDGSIRRTFRCANAARNGAPHRNEAGQQVGCRNKSIRLSLLLDVLRAACSAADFPADAAQEGAESHYAEIVDKIILFPEEIQVYFRDLAQPVSIKRAGAASLPISVKVARTSS